MSHTMGHERNHMNWNNIDSEFTTDKVRNLRKHGADVRKKQGVESKENEVYRVINAYAIKGEKITHDKLAYLVDLDRKRLRPYTTRLIKKGSIIREKGLHGRYFLINESYKDPLLKARLFSNIFRQKILGQENLVTTPTPTPTQTKYDYPELALSEFSNRMGAFITYTLIQSMSKHNTADDDLEDPKIKDALVNSYVETAITSVIPFLLPMFRDFIDKSLGLYFDEGSIPVRTWKCLECSSIGESFHGDIHSLEHHQKEFGHVKVSWKDGQQGHIPRKTRHSEESSRFLFDRKVTNRLQQAFATIYRRLNQEFSDILEKLPNEIESYKKFLQRTHHKLKEQELCHHEYGKPAVTLQGLYRKQCIKCHYFKKVRRPMALANRGSKIDI